MPTKRVPVIYYTVDRNEPISDIALSELTNNEKPIFELKFNIKEFKSQYD